MAEVTLQLLRQYLERFGWSRYQLVEEPYEKEGMIVTGWRSSPQGDGYHLAIDPMVEQGSLSFRAPHLLYAPLDSTPGERLHELWLAMVHINHRLVLGKFSYDSTDGEVRFSVDVPIDQSPFSYQQFLHAMRVVIEAVETYAPLLRRIVAGQTTAKVLIAKESAGEEAMTSAFGQMLREMLQALERERGSGQEEPSEARP
jgi:hypothetical protein